MGAKRYCVYISDKDLMEGLEAMASAKAWSRNDVFREAVRTYLTLDSISSELSEFERRQAATSRELGRQIQQLRNDFQLLMAFFDLFTRSYYVHTPPVPPEAVDASASSAKLRYERLLRQLPSMFQGESGLVGVSTNLESSVDSRSKTAAAEESC